MLEIKGDLFAQNGPIVIPVNCETKKNGEAVMGAGVAKALITCCGKGCFREAFPAHFGEALMRFNHEPHVWRWDEGDGFVWFTFPTKTLWKQPSNIHLIMDGAVELREIVDKIIKYKVVKDWQYYQKIYLPHLGCGLGGLNWEKEVKPNLSILLDDRFVAVSE